MLEETWQFKYSDKETIECTYIVGVLEYTTLSLYTFSVPEEIYTAARRRIA
jgi:hypothetical protein